MAELYELTATEMLRRVRAGEISRRELIQTHLDRIATVNKLVNAIVQVRADEALAEAEVADRDTGDRGALPLDGVPVSVKDHFDVTGMWHTEGVPSMADRTSPGDAVVVQRLRNAGAIVIGKCNQPDFQIRWNTVSTLFGATMNPRNLELSAGGSSGGDAAAVASGMAATGLGLDYGGSIRVPASFCEIFGLRPSAGRVPETNVLPPLDWPPTFDLMSSTGPMARSLDDIWTTFRVLAGGDPSDPATVDVPIREPDPAARCRVARMIRQTGAIVEPEVEAAVERAAAALTAAGYEVVDSGIPHAERAPELWAELVGAELLHVGFPAWGDQMGDSGRQHIEAMMGLFDLGTELPRYVGSFMERRTVQHEVARWMESHPLVLAPIAGMATPPLAFDHDLTAPQTRALFDHMRNVMWVNLLGLPSIALPAGIQLVGRRFHEEDLMPAARVVAEAFPPVSVAKVNGAG